MTCKVDNSLYVKYVNAPLPRPAERFIFAQSSPCWTKPKLPQLRITFRAFSFAKRELQHIMNEKENVVVTGQINICLFAYEPLLKATFIEK